MSANTQTDYLKRLWRPDILIELEAKVSGPLDLLQLRNRLDRLRLSKSLDSTSPESAVEYLIQFKPQTWEALNRLAEQLGAEGACVTPADVATLLIECSLAQMEGNARE